MDMLTIAVWAIFFGIVFACFYTRYQTNLMSDFIDSLVLCKAFDKESAKKIDQLGFSNNVSFKFLKTRLETNIGLSRIIFRVQETDLKPDNNNQLTLFKPQNTYKYYISEDQIEFAKDKFKKDTTPFWKSLVLVIALLIVTCFATTIINFFNGYTQSAFTKSDKNQNITQEYQDNNTDDNLQKDDQKNNAQPDDSSENHEIKDNDNQEFTHPVIPTPDNNY